MVKRQIVVRS